MVDKRACGFSLGSILSLIMACPAYAQASGGGAIEEVVVTARRVSESLQSVPIAVTAVTAQALVTKQVINMADLQRTAPDVTIGTGSSGGAGFTFIAIRGAAQNSPNSASDPAVGIYIDGVYIARPSNTLLNLVDVSQVEVLRGPQGTLFGRNTTGGAFNITTADPTGEFSGRTLVERGNYNLVRFQQVLNVPLQGDELAARLAFQYQDHHGYGDNLTTNTPAGDLRDDVLVRGKLRWAPSNLPLTMTLSGDYSRFKNSGQIQALQAINTDFALPFGPGGSPVPLGAVFGAFGLDFRPYLQTRSRFYDTYGTGQASPGLEEQGDRLISKGISANIEADVGSIKIKSITAYRKISASTKSDLDGMAIDLLYAFTTFDQQQFSQELQFIGGVGPVEWIAGAYYFQERSFEQSTAHAFGFANPFFFANRGNANNYSSALYAQVNYQFTDKLRLTGGFRYTWDKRVAILRNVANAFQPAVGANCIVATDDPAGCAQRVEKKFSYPAYTVSLDYQATDALMLYAKTSGASMAGGWNLRIGSVPAFKPEANRDVELGLKGDFFDRRLRTNIAAFYIWQRDVQRIKNTAVGNPPATTQFVQNAGKAHLKGVELEVTALPWEGMELNGSLGLLDSQYVKGTFLDTQLVGGVPVSVDRSGESLPQAPEVTWSLGATQKFPTQLGELSFHGDYAYTSKKVFYSDTPSALQSPAVKAQYATANAFGIIPAFGIYNARVALKVADSRLEVAGWVRNLTDKKYYTNINDYYTAIGYVANFVGTPRTYGVTLTYDW